MEQIGGNLLGCGDAGALGGGFKFRLPVPLELETLQKTHAGTISRLEASAGALLYIEFRIIPKPKIRNIPQII